MERGEHPVQGPAERQTSGMNYLQVEELSKEIDGDTYSRIL